MKIPRISTNNSKLYLSELRKKYAVQFHHELQLSNTPEGSFFYILLKHEKLNCAGDPRPQQLMVDIKSEDTEEDDRKKFEASEKKDISRPSVNNLLAPLFLQRRNSRISLPTISARGPRAPRKEPVSVSDNPEASEVD